MNEKERIKKTISFNKIDKIPWQINYTTEIADRIMSSINIEKLQYKVLGKNIYTYNKLDNFLGNHIAYVRNRAVNSVKEIKIGFFQDEWGVIWDRTTDKDIGVPVNCVLEDSDFSKLEIPDPDDPDRYAHFQPTIDANKNRYILAKFSYSLFERAWSLRGMENLMVDFITNPDFVHELFNKITNFNLKIIENLKNFNIDGIYFGDDWGQQGGLLMSPDMWRKFIKPYLKIMYKKTHDSGYAVFIHSCGDITKVLDDLIEIGLDVFNPFQPEVIDIEHMLKEYSHKLAFYGGVSIQKTLPFSSTLEVTREIENKIELATKYGGLIISPSHDMPPDISVNNVIAMLRRIKCQ